MFVKHLRWPLRLAAAGLSAIGIVALVLTSMIATPLKRPPELASITAGVRQVDFSDLPAVQRMQARDGTELAYRLYEPATQNSDRIAILVHGSAGSSQNMHALAKALAVSGIRAVSVDMRGHGRSGTRGDIAYLGQLDDDLADTVAFLRRTWPNVPMDLVGHSAGGGFALRTAGGANGDLFDRYILLAPYLGYFAPTSRPDSKESHWAEADMPRIIALALLRRAGITCCQDLPVLAFALPANAALHATTQYSYRLLTNFGVSDDYKSTLAASRKPIAIVTGAEDELMVSGRYAEVLRVPGHDVTTTIVPGVDHMGIIAAPTALDAIVAAVKQKAPS